MVQPRIHHSRIAAMSVSNPVWLPDHQLGVVATLAHVDELIEEVGKLLLKYQTSNGDLLKLKEVRKGPVNQAVVVSIAPLPRKIPLLVADALIALRAAVEHALFAEVEFLNGSPLTSKEARTIEMPARLTYDEFADWSKNRLRNAPAPLKPDSELVRRISGLQPFHRLDRPDLHPLARLASHTNHAKHRTPAVAALRMVAIAREDETPRSVRELPLLPEEPLRAGQVLAETPIGIQLPVSLFPSVGINRPGTDEWPILMRELAEIAEWVRTQAVPRLVTGREPPKPELPAHYDIRIGHSNERCAISLGSTESAAERNKRSWSAASARHNLIDLLQMLPGAPDQKRLTGWIEQLNDDEVLERISRVKPLLSYEAETIQSNYSALEGLRDEALAFSYG